MISFLAQHTPGALAEVVKSPFARVHTLAVVQHPPADAFSFSKEGVTRLHREAGISGVVWHPSVAVKILESLIASPVSNFNQRYLLPAFSQLQYLLSQLTGAPFGHPVLKSVFLGVLSMLVFQPLEVVALVCDLDYMQQMYGPGVVSSLVHCTGSIHKAHGLSGFWIGLREDFIFDIATRLFSRATDPFFGKLLERLPEHVRNNFFVRRFRTYARLLLLEPLFAARKLSTLSKIMPAIYAQYPGGAAAAAPLALAAGSFSFSSALALLNKEKRLFAGAFYHLFYVVLREVVKVLANKIEKKMRR